MAPPQWDDETSVTMQAEVPLQPREERRDRAHLIVIAGPSVGQMFKIQGTGTDANAVIGRGRDAHIRVFDEGVSRAHARIWSDVDRLYVEDLTSRNGTFVNGRKIEQAIPLADGDKIQVGSTTILKFTYHDALDESFHEHMYESALRDALTKVFNKRYFSDRLDAELRFAHRHRTGVVLLLIDIDHFKRVNDSYGHVAGDTVLAAVAGALARGVRNEDVVARYGGEEFAVLTRAISAEEGKVLAERLRRVIESIEVDADEGMRVKVTVSIGVAAYPDSQVETALELVEAADAALYRAKNGGRNRVAT